jgi:lysophospholipase L1-like esterase
MVDALITEAYPDLRLRVLNVGTSGNTVRDLQARWERDVVAHQPDYVAIMIGTNDVWRQFDSPLRPEAAVGPEEYQRTLRSLAIGVGPNVSGLIMMTPFFIEPLKTDAMRARMDEYGSIVRQIAHDTEARFVDTQGAFDRMLKHGYSAALSWDRVHPGHVGHMVLAQAFLRECLRP